MPLRPAPFDWTCSYGATASPRTRFSLLDDSSEHTRGLEVRVHDLLKDEEQLGAVISIGESGRLRKAGFAGVLHVRSNVLRFHECDKTGPAIDQLRTANLYTRKSCPRCQKLKAFLPTLQQRWPAIRFVIHDVDQSRRANTMGDPVPTCQHRPVTAEDLICPPRDYRLPRRQRDGSSVESTDRSGSPASNWISAWLSPRADRIRA